MTNNDLQQIDNLIKKNLKGVATKKDLSSVESRLGNVESRLSNVEPRMATKRDLERFTTKKDLIQLEARLRKDMATKKDLQGLRKELKNDIDDAVTQVITAVDNTVSPLARRVTRIEEHLELPIVD